MERKFLYKNYIRTLQDKFVRRLSDIQADFNFDHGDEFEIAICEVLRSFLPHKYGICRGHAIHENDTSAGDDIIIYDQERFPTLKLLKKDDYARKENIPIEAIYAYIEAKHTLNLSNNESTSIGRAMEQVKTVKMLCASRIKTHLGQWDPYVRLDEDFIVGNYSFPNYRNPVLGVILARHIAIDGKRTTDPELINRTFAESGLKVDPQGPDLIIAGPSNFLSPAFQDEKGSAPTVFLLPEKHYGLEYYIREDIAFGIFLAHLAFAVDWIRLEKMPWQNILNDAKYGTTQGLPW